MRQMFLATTALSLSLALAACNDDKGGTDNTSTFNGINQKIAALDSAQQQNKATIDDQNKEIASLKQARADDTAAFETRLAAVVKTIDERPDISPELEKRLVALKEQIGKIPAFSTAEEFEDFKTKVEALRTDLDKAPKTAKVAELSDSLAALSDKFASATDFKEVENYVDGVKTKLDALLAAADPELLKTLKDTLAGLRTDLAGKATFTDADIMDFRDRIAGLEKLIDTKANDIPPGINPRHLDGNRHEARLRAISKETLPGVIASIWTGQVLLERISLSVILGLDPRTHTFLKQQELAPQYG